MNRRDAEKRKVKKEENKLMVEECLNQYQKKPVPVLHRTQNPACMQKLFPLATNYL